MKLSLTFTYSLVYFLLSAVKESAASSIVKLDTDSVSQPTKSAYLSIFCGYKARAAYTGPILQLRRSSDNSVVDFYGDFELATGSGTSLTSWLAGSTAYVVTWYDQSGYDRHAIQTTVSLQPKFDPSAKYVDFKTSAYMNIPYQILPLNNGAFSFTTQHGSINTDSGDIFGIGDFSAGNKGTAFRRYGTAYVSYWWSNDLASNAAAYAANNIVTITYDPSTAIQKMFIEKTLNVQRNMGSHNTQPSNGFLGRTLVTTELLNGELYYLVTTSNVLSDADRLLLESSVAVVTTPSTVPTTFPSITPSAQPSVTPTAVPSPIPSASPSTTPSAVPSVVPSATPSSAPSEAPTFAVPEYSLTVSAKSFKYFEVKVYTQANERVFPVSYELVDCPENAGAVIWGHASTPITEDTNTCVYGLPRHYWCECPALVNGNKPKLTLNFGGTVFDRVELLILDWVDGEVVVSDSANNIVLFSASRAGGPLVGEEFVGYDHLNLLQVAPSVVPTITPSSVPTTKTSWTPTTKPSIPSVVPTQTPTVVPTTTAPSAEPSVTPSMVPSAAPSFTAQYTITLTAKTFKYFEVRVYTYDNLRIFPLSYELEHCPENAGVAVWNEQTTEDTNTCVYGYPRNFWCQCAAVADAKPKLVLHMGHTVFDRVELLLLNWEDGEVTVTDEANHETFLSATHDGVVGNEFMTFDNLNLEHAAAPIGRKLLRGG